MGICRIIDHPGPATAGQRRPAPNVVSRYRSSTMTGGRYTARQFPSTAVRAKAAPPLPPQIADRGCARTAGRMRVLLTGVLRRWLSQDVARANAAQASARLQHRRREFQDVEVFLDTQHHRPFQPPVDTSFTNTKRTGLPQHGLD